MTYILYGIALLGVGWWLRREAADAEGYFLAGRRLGPWAVGFSLAATGFGGSALLIASTLVYRHGLAGLWFSGSAVLGFMVLGLGFARRIRATGAHSLADYVARELGPATGRMAASLIVVIEVAFFGLTIQGFALVVTPLLGAGHPLLASPPLFIALSAAVIVAYTLLGGHKAVAVTDLVQIALIAGTLGLLLLPRALAQAQMGELPPAALAVPFGEGAGPIFALNMLVLMGLSGVIGGDVFAKMLSARDPASARRGALIAAGALGALAVMVALLALSARALLPGLESPALAVPLLARELLPPVLFQVVSLALLSVLLSTGDSVLLTGVTHLAWDVLRLGERATATVVRGLTVLLAAAGIALTLYLEGLLPIMRFGYTLLVAGLVVPVGASLLVQPVHRPSRRWFQAAMIAGLLAAVVGKTVDMAGGSTAGLDPATLGVMASLLVMGWGMGRARGRFVERENEAAVLEP